MLDLRKKEKLSSHLPEYDKLLRLASLQLDFDLVALALTVFFSGGLNSPIIAMFIVYIMISTFLINYHKAFRNTLDGHRSCSWPSPCCKTAKSFSPASRS